MNKIDLNKDFFSGLNKKKQHGGDKDIVPPRPSVMFDFFNKLGPQSPESHENESMAGRFNKPPLEKPTQPEAPMTARKSNSAADIIMKVQQRKVMKEQVQERLN